jgi:putative hydrolase of the HAD superfamily
LGCEVTWADFVEAWNSIFDSVPILPEALIVELARRLDLWVVSNTNKLHFDYILQAFGFLRHFRGYVLSHEVGAMKPDPRIFEVALIRASKRADEVVFVDDQAANVAAAQTLGIDAFEFVGPDQFESEMRKRRLI